MKYLKKGGRISPAAAAIGGILKLRPVLLLNGGQLGKFALPRTLAKAKETMINAVLDDLNGKFKEFFDKGEMKLCIAHANNPQDAELLKAEVQKRIPNLEIVFTDAISLSIACHTGPGALVLACMHVVK
jgi:fatty acid-binding protein DegV